MIVKLILSNECLLHGFQPCPFFVTFMYKTSPVFSLRDGTFRLFVDLGIRCCNSQFLVVGFLPQNLTLCATVWSEEILLWACAPQQGPSTVIFIQHRHLSFVSDFCNKMSSLDFFLFFYICLLYCLISTVFSTAFCVLYFLDLKGSDVKDWYEPLTFIWDIYRIIIE